MIKKLILSPHIDDEVLGCGGILDSNTFVLYCGMDESHIQKDWVKERPKVSERLKELELVANITNHKYKILENKVNHYKIVDLISPIESLINEIQPIELYIPHPSYNQDHRAVYKAALTALRPHDLNYFVSRVLIYEQPHMIFWDQEILNPNYYIPIDIERKLNLYSLMKSQVRDFRSPQHIKSIAKLRGGASNCEYAEGYKILRWVISEK